MIPVLDMVNHRDGLQSALVDRTVNTLDASSSSSREKSSTSERSLIGLQAIRSFGEGQEGERRGTQYCV